MKKWIDKTWAKVTAFCLLVVFTALSAAGGLGIAWLISEDAYADGGESLQEKLYGNICANELYEAAYCLWDISGQELVCRYSSDWQYPHAEITTPQDAWPRLFEDRFGDSACSLCLYDMEGNVVLVNYSPPNESKYESELFLYSGWDDYRADKPAYRLAAVLPANRTLHNQIDAFQEILLTWRHALIAIEVLCLAAWLFLLVFSLASAGHWQGHEGIHLTWFDKIPMDLWLAGILLLGLWREVKYIWNFIFEWYSLALLVPFFYLLLIAFAAQCKAGTVLKSSAIAWLLRLLRRAVRWIVYVLRRIPLVWKTALGVAALLFFDLVCVMNGHDEEYLFVMLAVHLLAGLFLIYLTIGLRKLQKGGQALARGDYESPVDTRRLFGDFRRHGEDLNAARKGLQLAVAQQLKSERLKTELITNVSHDIKTPLTSIVNYVDLLKKTDIQDPDAKEYIDVLDRQSQRLRKLTEDLVEASKAASGAVPVSFSDTDVNVFLAQVLGEYRQRLTDCQLEPVLTTDENQPHIQADGKLLWRVLDNLLGNVCKYALPGTRVYLSSEVVGGQVLLTLKNISRYPLNISADELTERFVRGDASRSSEGSGLGLSIAMGLTKLQQGEFRLSVDGDLFKVQLIFPQIAE